MKNNNGSLKQTNEYFYECKNICESDSFCALHECIENINSSVEWRLMFAPNIEINVNREVKILDAPKYFVFFANYSDGTYDIIRFDIREARYLSGYNESRKFYKEELEWVIQKLSTNYNWEYFLDCYNDAFHYEDKQNENWIMPDYGKLELEE